VRNGLAIAILERQLIATQFLFILLAACFSACTCAVIAVVVATCRSWPPSVIAIEPLAATRVATWRFTASFAIAEHRLTFAAIHQHFWSYFDSEQFPGKCLTERSLDSGAV
jgi:hypothetical protein